LPGGSRYSLPCQTCNQLGSSQSAMQPGGDSRGWWHPLQRPQPAAAPRPPRNHAQPPGAVECCHPAAAAAVPMGRRSGGHTRKGWVNSSSSSVLCRSMGVSGYCQCPAPTYSPPHVPPSVAHEEGARGVIQIPRGKGAPGRVHGQRRGRRFAACARDAADAARTTMQRRLHQTYHTTASGAQVHGCFVRRTRALQ
jgi:hypothetical protein